MIGDDRWARVTPFEIGLPGRDFAEAAFHAIRVEIDQRGVDASDPGAFLQLGEVGRVLRELQGDDRGGEVLQRFGSFLFHAFRFNESGRVFLLLDEAVARQVVDGEAAPDWRGDLPSGAGYLQLPKHLFWAEGESGNPEPVDGGFWATTAGDTLSLLLATGMRGGRPGLSLVEVPPVELSALEGLVGEQIREQGPDYATTLPGGELDNLYSIDTLGEALKLFGRVFGALAAAPDLLGPEESAGAGERVTHGALPPSTLPFRRIGPISDTPGDG